MIRDDGGPAIDLGTRIRLGRVAAHLDQQQLADKVGVARNSISNWETGRSEPSAGAFVRLARALDVSLEWLATGLDPPAKPATLRGHARGPDPSRVRAWRTRAA